MDTRYAVVILMLMFGSLTAAQASPAAASTSGDSTFLVLSAGWNLISLPCAVPDIHVNAIFPHALSQAFTYHNGYSGQDTMVPGIGYWLKYPAKETVAVSGTPITELSISLDARWNMIGTMSIPLPFSTLQTTPASIIINGTIFQYDTPGGYTAATRYEPGRGYWVKTTRAGTAYASCWVAPEEMLINPPDGSAFLAAPRLYWRGASCIKQYRLQVARDSLFHDLLFDTIQVNITSYQWHFDCRTTDHYWRVGLASLDSQAAWSPHRHFRWIFPEQFSLVAPEDESRLLSPPLLQWKRSSSSCPLNYHLQVAGDSLFSMLLLDTTMTDTSYQWPFDCRTEDYYWRVGLPDLYPVEEWTQRRHFQWSYREDMVIYPRNGDDVSLAPLLAWHAALCGGQFRMQCAHDSLLTDLIKDTIMTDTTYQCDSLTLGQDYYWQLTWIRNPEESIRTGAMKIHAATWQYLGLNTEYLCPKPAIDYTDSNIIYAGSMSIFQSPTIGGLFKTTDGGMTWDTLIRGLEPIDIKIHPFDHNIIYCAIMFNGATPINGIIKSTDAGQTWVCSDSGVFRNWERSPFCIVFNPIHPDTMYTASSGFGTGQIFKSTNGGQYWSGTDIWGQITDIEIDQNHPSILYTVDTFFGQLLKSTDAGISSTAVPTPGRASNVKVSLSNSDSVYLGSSLGMYISTNGGNSWEKFDNGLPPDSPCGLWGLDKVSGTVYINCTNQFLGNKLYRMDAGRISWTSMPHPGGSIFISPLGKLYCLMRGIFQYHR